MKNTFNVGDKVRVRSDLVGGTSYNSSGGQGCYFNYSMATYRGEEFTIQLIDSVGYTYLEGNDRSRVDTMLEKVEAKSTKSRPTYSRKAERNDGVVFERDAIGGRSLKEITESISERKESIKRDESLLRAHRNLFPKK